MQVWKVFDSLCKGLPSEVASVSALCLIGQRSFSEERKLLLSEPPDIVVCTPGRLADHLFSEGASTFNGLRWLVADEADRLLSQTYHRWLELVDKLATVSVQGDEAGSASSFVAPPLQKLLFSATMTWNPQKLAALKLRRPLFFFSSKTGQYATPVGLHQRYITCKFRTKPLALLRVLRHMLGATGEGSSSAPSAIVFCSSVEDAHRLARLLEVICLLPAITAAEAESAGTPEATEQTTRTAAFIPEELKSTGSIVEFSSNLTQGQRTKLLKRFRSGRIRCLVCSDVVARGIDMPDVQVVVNYSVPANIQTYIHRSGRTARAGREGYAFTLLRDDQVDGFMGMLSESADCAERIQHEDLPRKKPPEGWYKRALSLLTETLELESMGLISPSEVLKLRHFLNGGAEAQAAEKPSQDTPSAAPENPPEPALRPKTKRALPDDAEAAPKAASIKKKRLATHEASPEETPGSKKEKRKAEPEKPRSPLEESSAKLGGRVAKEIPPEAAPPSTLLDFLRKCSVVG